MAGCDVNSQLMAAKQSQISAERGAAAPASMIEPAIVAAKPANIESADPEFLQPVANFASIGNEANRSKALFREMGKVLQHPRCLNCHPKDDRPRQGLDMALHNPPVLRGPDNRGTPAMECDTCHGKANFKYAVGPGSIPGHPKWHLAPIEMAWVGKSLNEICEQLKDESRSHKTLEELHEHNANDTLVGWGWKPGAGRQPAPGTQKQFGELTRAWIDSGAECPER